MTSSTKKVIVIGAGFGGCAAAQELAKCGFDVTLFDKRNHHLFQPLLYQVATALLSPAQIAYPIRAMFKKQKNVRVLIGNITRVDLAKRTVQSKRSNQEFHYDYLIIAAGARHAYFGHQKWEKYAWGLKTTRDALQIRERMIYSFEKAERTRSEAKRRKFSTFVIIGAGPTGVEMAGAIIELTRNSMRDDFTKFNPKNSRVILVEGSPRVLSAYSKKLSDIALKDLVAMGVDVRLNALVSNVTEEGVYIGEDVFIETENIIWAAGNVAAPLIKNVTSAFNASGQAEVNHDFSIKEDKNVFCIGDCAHLKDANNIVVPAIAPGALQSGKFVAKQIYNDRKGKKRDTFLYKDKGMMATIGRSRAIASIGKFEIYGFFAWFLWCVIHILFLINFRNKLLVIFDWFVSYFTHKRSVRLINAFRDRQSAVKD